MARILKTAAFVIAMAALATFVIFGFIIWVFIPLLPAAVLYLIGLYSARRTSILGTRGSGKDHRKAA